MTSRSRNHSKCFHPQVISDARKMLEIVDLRGAGPKNHKDIPYPNAEFSQEGMVDQGAVRAQKEPIVGTQRDPMRLAGVFLQAIAP